MSLLARAFLFVGFQAATGVTLAAFFLKARIIKLWGAAWGLALVALVLVQLVISFRRVPSHPNPKNRHILWHVGLGMASLAFRCIYVVVVWSLIESPQSWVLPLCIVQLVLELCAILAVSLFVVYDFTAPTLESVCAFEFIVLQLCTSVALPMTGERLADIAKQIDSMHLGILSGLLFPATGMFWFESLELCAAHWISQLVGGGDDQAARRDVDDGQAARHEQAPLLHPDNGNALGRAAPVRPSRLEIIAAICVPVFTFIALVLNVLDWSNVYVDCAQEGFGAALTGLAALLFETR